MDRDLEWKVLNKEKVYHTPVFDLIKQKEEAPNGYTDDYYVIDAGDWVMTIGEYKDCFVLVRQYRHGYYGITAEFPGGIIEKNEDPAKAAAREFTEETGFSVGKISLLGKCNPNPALYSNTLYVFLAEGLEPEGLMNPDEDEFIKYELVPKKDVLSGFGSGEYQHGLMGAAIAFYFMNRGIGEI